MDLYVIKYIILTLNKYSNMNNFVKTNKIINTK